MKLAVKPAADEFNACVLILNHTLDGIMDKGNRKAIEKFEGHIECLGQALRAFNGGKDVPRSDFLPSPYEVQKAICNRQFIGWLGGIEIYRSRILRMITIRLYVQPNTFHLVREKDLA